MASLFWRILIQEGVSDPEGPFRVRRIHMSDTPGGPTLTSGGQAFASSGTAASAFDSGTSTWLSESGSPQWIGYEFPDTVDIVEVRIDSHQTASHMPSYPGWFKIQSSDDGIEWEDRGEFRDVIFRTNQTLSFLVDPIRTTTLSFTSVSTIQGAVNKGASAQTGMNSYAGDGSIAGQIRINGAPAPGFVSLFDSERGILVGRDETNSIGEYKFENLNRAILYDVIAQDQNREWEKKVSSLRRPVAEDLQFPMSISEGATMEAIDWFSDPLWSSVSSLMHFDGELGAPFLDETGRNWSAYGGIDFDSSISKFGHSSASFNGTTTYLETGPSVDFSPLENNGKMTIEFFIRPAESTRLEYILSARSGNSLASAWVIERRSSGEVAFLSWDSNQNQMGTSAPSPPINHLEWSHIAVTIDNTEVRVYANGIGGQARILTGIPDGQSQRINLGRSAASGEQSRTFTGHIDELRVTRGFLRYTDNFIPPSSPFLEGP